MSVIEHGDGWTPPNDRPWTEAEHYRWTANHHREYRVQAEKDRARLTEQLAGAVDDLRELCEALESIAILTARRGGKTRLGKAWERARARLDGGQ